jgi:hypothetical protein
LLSDEILLEYKRVKIDRLSEVRLGSFATEQCFASHLGFLPGEMEVIEGREARV